SSEHWQKVANAPCVAPKTRSPTLYLWDAVAVMEGRIRGTATTVPANSVPDIQGKGGWCWYLPRICRRSKKLVAAAWILITYCFAEGAGFGRVVTLRSSGPETYWVSWIPRIVADGKGSEDE